MAFFATTWSIGPDHGSCPGFAAFQAGTQHALGAGIQTGLVVGERPVLGVPRIPRRKSHPVTGIDVKRNACERHVGSARLRHFTMFTAASQTSSRPCA